MAAPAKKLTAEQLKGMSPRQQKAVVLKSEAYLVDQYAALRKKVRHLQAWLKLAGKSKLQSDKHSVVVAAKDVVDMKKLKKYVNPKIIAKCMASEERASVRVYRKKEAASA